MPISEPCDFRLEKELEEIGRFEQIDQATDKAKEPRAEYEGQEDF